MNARWDRGSAIQQLGVLTLGAFVALRLAGVTDWSWWWVLSPLWVTVAIGLVVLGAVIVPVLLLLVYGRFRLRSRLRQSFPEIFIDPTAWSRVPADQSDDR
jgi:hypothetical protein